MTQAALLNKYLLNCPSSRQWQKIGAQKRAGVLVPLFSVFSSESIGIADFSDLKLLIDWIKLSGNSILQLLPMNYTGPTLCPYDSVSSFALEPSYICLREASAVSGYNLTDAIEQLKKLFGCGGTHVDYAVKKEKTRILKEVCAAEKNCPEPLVKFKADNNYWLEDFALYQVLKDVYRGKPWYEWEERFKNRYQEALREFKQAHIQEVNYQIWLQWQLYEQFSAAKVYAGSKGVLLKGDLPILVSRDSADVWAHPGFFKLEFASGAPPDMYCAKGQRWGMPTYNWDNIAADGYRYLKERLKYAENFYDIIRIDHAVGVFRIWSIPYYDPEENQGLNGHFDPENVALWGPHGKNILTQILQSTNMLLCAEDLGVIPEVCPKTLAELGIPGNDVQRWTKDWVVRHDFLGPQEYRLLSVAVLSTHDTTNWPAWWQNEAGTVDAELFIRKCIERHINFAQIKDTLFDPDKSFRGRLRWRKNISTVDILTKVLGKKKEEIADFIDIYNNSYLEKEKLWKHLGKKGKMQEKCSVNLLRSALAMTLESAAIFCVNTLIDWLYLTDLQKGDPYRWRINTPGTVSVNNWSLVIPISLDNLSGHKVTRDIRAMVTASGRI